MTKKEAEAQSQQIQRWYNGMRVLKLLSLFLYIWFNFVQSACFDKSIEFLNMDFKSFKKYVQLLYMEV